MPTLSKSLRIFDGTPLQEIMASENRLVWRSPLEGYHEYLVDPVIASIYMALKTISVEWIDLLRKTYQREIWGIKKAPAFNQRMDFDALSKLVFVMEKETLIALLSWVKSGFSYQDIISQIARLKDQLAKAEHHIVSVNGLAEPTLNVQSFSVTDLAGRIYTMALYNGYTMAGFAHTTLADYSNLNSLNFLFILNTGKASCINFQDQWYL